MSSMKKEMNWRMQGMQYALEVADEKGIEGLRREIKKRGFLMTPITYTEAQIDEYWSFLSENLFSTVMTLTAVSLVDSFDFQTNELQLFKKNFQKNLSLIKDLDSLGGHYVTLSDLAKDLNEKHNLEIDIGKVELCQESKDEVDSNFQSAKIEYIIDLLKRNGYNDAAAFLYKTC